MDRGQNPTWPWHALATGWLALPGGRRGTHGSTQPGADSARNPTHSACANRFFFSLLSGRCRLSSVTATEVAPGLRRRDARDARLSKAVSVSVSVSKGTLTCTRLLLLLLLLLLLPLRRLVHGAASQPASQPASQQLQSQAKAARAIASLLVHPTRLVPIPSVAIHPTLPPSSLQLT